MTGTDEKKHFFDHPENIRKLLVVFFSVCALLFLIDGLDPTGIWDFKHDPESGEPRYHYGIEGWLGFYGIYGFVCCVALVLSAKVLRKIVMRSEDYYDR